MPIVDSKDLMFGRKGPLAKVSSKLIYNIFGLKKSNAVYDAVIDRTDDYYHALLEQFGVDYSFSFDQTANIPQEGPLILISNHPTGGFDGIIMLDVLTKIRPDIKVLGNFLLDRIEPMRKNIIEVNPFDDRESGNVTGLKQALRHVSGGGALLLFPAGEVATWQDGFSGIRDRQWSRTVIKFIRSCNAPVVPVYISARNSTLFRLAGKITPKLRTALLPHEMNNKHGKCFDIIIGTALSSRRQNSLTDIKTYGDYLRAMVDYLSEARKTVGMVKSDDELELSDIAARLPVEKLRGEIDTLQKEFLLFDYGNFSVFCVPPEHMPLMMDEIGRMREITFRQVGEGTLKRVDTDEYDSYYNQLFVWDNSCDVLVGAYRLGFGDRILASHGLEGFYTHSLFRYSDTMKEMLGSTIELGRSFVTKEYQRKPTPLLLLWKGIMCVLLHNRQYRYLVGPVTISGEFQAASKRLIVTHLFEHHYDSVLAAQVHPINGLGRIDSHIDTSLIKNIDDIEMIGKLVSDIERGGRTIPVLVKKYLQANSHVLGFNVDYDFCDSLDALMLLDLRSLPDSTIAMLSKEMNEKEVVLRFKV